MPGWVWINPEFRKYLKDHEPLPKRSLDKIPRHVELVRSLFGLPINLAVADSKQLFFDVGLAGALGKIGQEAIGLSGVPRESQILVVTRDEQRDEIKVEDNLWSIGSPHRNLLTRYLVSDKPKGISVLDLDIGLRADLHYLFHIPNEKIYSRGGYVSYTMHDRDIWGDGPLQSIKRIGKEHPELIQNPKMPRYLTPERERRREPLVTLKGPNRPLIPEYYDERLQKDYFMITRMPMLNEGSAVRGQTHVVVAGCHDLGTLHAMSIFYRQDLLEDIGNRVRGTNFQVIGYGDPWSPLGKYNIIDVVDLPI